MPVEMHDTIEVTGSPWVWQVGWGSARKLGVTRLEEQIEVGRHQPHASSGVARKVQEDAMGGEVDIRRRTQSFGDRSAHISDQEFSLE